jgi:hypothetical protein
MIATSGSTEPLLLVVREYKTAINVVVAVCEICKMRLQIERLYLEAWQPLRGVLCAQEYLCRKRLKTRHRGSQKVALSKKPSTVSSIVSPVKRPGERDLYNRFWINYDL